MYRVSLKNPINTPYLIPTKPLNPGSTLQALIKTVQEVGVMHRNFLAQIESLKEEVRKVKAQVGAQGLK